MDFDGDFLEKEIAPIIYNARSSFIYSIVVHSIHVFRRGGGGGRFPPDRKSNISDVGSPPIHSSSIVHLGLVLL